MCGTLGSNISLFVLALIPISVQNLGLRLRAHLGGAAALPRFSTMASSPPVLPLAAPLAEAFWIVMTDHLHEIDLDGLPMLFSNFEKARFAQVRHVRMGLGGTEAGRSRKISGFAAELAAGTSISGALVELFLTRLWAVVGKVDPESCFAPIATGEFLIKKRPHQGIWVEVDPPSVHAGAASVPRKDLVHSISAVTQVPGDAVAAPPTKVSKILAGVAASTLPTFLPNSSGSSHEVAEAPTAQAIQMISATKARVLVIELIKTLGPVSSAYQEVFGTPDTPVSDEVVQTMLDMVCHKLEPKVLKQYYRECNNYLSWVQSVGHTPMTVGSVLLCSYLKTTLTRGKSIPTVVRCALVWLEQHAGVKLGACGVAIRDYVAQLSHTTIDGFVPREQSQAPPLGVASVMALENLVETAHTLPLRMFAGVCCLCIHGVKRWADVQHVRDLSHTRDGVMLTTYKSKRKDKPMLWAALREGFGKGAWGQCFEDACAEAGLPRSDFLVLRPTADLKNFTSFPAGWADANRCLHALLVISGMKAEEAAKFTMHSCRHTYPTYAFQLLFPPPAVTLMGHWAAKADGVSSSYDGARTATELAYKAIVARNVRSGWKPVPHGSIPNEAVYPFQGISNFPPHPSTAASCAEPVGEMECVPAKGKSEDIMSVPRYVFPPGVVQVLNKRTNTVHLSRHKGTACGSWRCGDAKSPSENAEFASGTQRWTPQRNPFRFCLGCYGAQGLKKLGAKLRVGDSDIEDSVSTASEAVSDSE